MSTAAPPPTDPAAPRAADPTIGRLVAVATESLSGIVRDEIALAKAEVSVDAKKGVKGAAMFIGAAFLGLFGLFFLLHTIALGLVALGLAPWLGYLIVTLVLFVIAAILALIGKSAVSKIKGKPERTIDTTMQAVEAVKRSTSGAQTHAARLADPITHGATERTRPGALPPGGLTPTAGSTAAPAGTSGATAAKTD